MLLREKYTNLFFYAFEEYRETIEKGIDNFGLLDWASQFLVASKDFVDFNPKMGEYSLYYSPKCANVIAYDLSKENLNILKRNAAENSISNVERKLLDIYWDRVNKYYLHDNVGFIKIRHAEPLVVLQRFLQTLVSSSFPPILMTEAITTLDAVDFLTTLGYKFIKVSGVENTYLAAEHPVWKKVIEKIKATEEQNKNAERIIAEKAEEDLVAKIVSTYESSGKLETWEEYWKVSRYYNEKGEHEKAYKAGKESFGFKIPEQKKHLLLKELAVSAYYVKQLDEGYEVCENIFLSNYSPFEIRNWALNTQRYYMKKLALKAKKITIGTDLPEIYKPSSSAVIKVDNGFIVNCRAVNYSINMGQGGSYTMRDPQGIVRTKNFLYRLDNNLEIIPNSRLEVVDQSGAVTYPTHILGLEDLRLFSEKYFFCTSLEHNQHRAPRMCFGEININSGKISRIIPLSIPDGNPTHTEKNWLPFIQNDEIYFVYSFNPFTLYKLDKETGVSVLVKRLSIPHNMDGMRGSASPIPYKNGWLFTLHQVVFGSPRKYFHRLGWMDNNFNQLKVSKVFYINYPTIEYNLSICHSDHGLLFPYSLQDNSSTIGILDYSTVDAMLTI